MENKRYNHSVGWQPIHHHHSENIKRTMKPQILYVEDEHDLGLVTKQYLQTMDLDVLWCLSADSAYNAYIKNTFNVVIIDVQLPDVDGFTLAQRILAYDSDAYLIFLTARSMKEDRLKGLRLGAVDYITKPFDVEELVLRIRNIVSKQSNKVRSGNGNDDSILQIADVRFDAKKLTISVGKDYHSTLTLREAELISCLLQSRNTILRREEILMKVWGNDDYFLGRSLDVFVSRIRKMLAKSHSVKLENVYGVGFILSSPD